MTVRNRATQAFVIVAAASFAGGFVVGRVSNVPAEITGPLLSRDDVRASWAAAVEAARPDPARLSADAIIPVDDYFRQRAIPNIQPFVKDMAGFFSSLNLTWLKVRDWWSKGEGRSRVEAKVGEALERRMGMPSELEAAVKASVQRFESLQNQADARFRNEAYAVLRGAGVRVDPARLDQVQATAAHAALAEALRDVGVRESQTLAAGSIGGLVSSVVVDTVVTAAVTTAIATGAGAGGAAAGGAAGGAGAGSVVPGAGTITGLIVGGVAGTLVYLAADSYFETKAKDKMTDSINALHAETRTRLDTLFRSYSDELDRQRMNLLDKLLLEAGR